jgi:hypothetical protein
MPQTNKENQHNTRKYDVSSFNCEEYLYPDLKLKSNMIEDVVLKGI